MLYINNNKIIQSYRACTPIIIFEKGKKFYTQKIFFILIHKILHPLDYFIALLLYIPLLLFKTNNTSSLYY